MALHQIVCVFDEAVGCFGNPMAVVSLGAAIRQFQDEVNRQDENNLLFKHPEHFVLYQVGIFDDNEGRFENKNPAPAVLIRGTDCVGRKVS